MNIVAVSPHRREALQAVAWAIDELKMKVPIWKKEFYEDGEETHEMTEGQHQLCECSHKAEWKGNPEF